MLDALDEYRTNYDSLPFSEHQAMYERIEEVYPEQSWWNAEDCAHFLAQYRPARVVEIGGHDGGLAAAVLPNATSVKSWTNYELVESPQVCDDPRYEVCILRDWAWSVALNADALILSHVVEHLSEARLWDLLRNLSCPAVYVDAPLHEDVRTHWAGTETAHVLPYSMQDLDSAFSHRGYLKAYANVSNARGLVSRTRWYEL